MGDTNGTIDSLTHHGVSVAAVRPLQIAVHLDRAAEPTPAPPIAVLLYRTRSAFTESRSRLASARTTAQSP